MNQEVLAVLTKYVAEQILKQPNRLLEPDRKLISTGLIDSFSLVDLALFVEDTFAVHIDDTELTAQTFDSLQELANLVESRK